MKKLIDDSKEKIVYAKKCLFDLHNSLMSLCGHSNTQIIMADTALSEVLTNLEKMEENNE